MSEDNAIARPYGKAAFEYALAQKVMPKWWQQLNLLKLVCEDERIQNLLANPTIAQQRLAKLILDIVSEQLSDAVVRFVNLLAENKRLHVLPAIVDIFEQYKRRWEKTMEVQLTTISPVTDDYKDSIARVLEQRLKSKIALSTNIDEAILGGAIIRAGDRVFDGSIRGRIHRLRQEFLYD